MMHFKFFVLAAFIIYPFFLFAQPFVITNTNMANPISGYTSFFYDTSGKANIYEVENKNFLSNKGDVINLGIKPHPVWIKIDVKNESNEENLYLKIAQPITDNITFFSKEPDNNFLVLELSEAKNFYSRYIGSPNYIFPITISKNTTKRFYLKVISVDQIQSPISIGTKKAILQKEADQSLLFGLYAGIVIIMLLYNFFIYITVKDRSYVYYIVFIFFVGFTQAVLKGYAFKFFWPQYPAFNIYSTIIIPVFSGITTGLFMQQFLQTKKLAPKLHAGINAFIALYIISALIALLYNKHLGLTVLQFVAFLGAVYALIVGWAILKKGVRIARFFIIAYSIFFSAVVIFVLSNFSILPYNNLTANILELGSAIQILLLSFALADKINTYRKEQILAKQESLMIAKENERLITEQNILLEKEVKERTRELQESNNNLSNTLVQLKEAQIKLVDSEKMVSLGQLTAGIAHEINNPINFVAANVKPLELDIIDLQEIIKKYEAIDTAKNVDEQFEAIENFKRQIDIDYITDEIKTLLAGIKDGANRTAEIVSNLKNFVRVDQANAKYVNLNEGINSTLLLIRNTFPDNFTLQKEFGDIPPVECVPGKINQVFMNIITNAIQAIKHKQSQHGGAGILQISTLQHNSDEVKIHIKDNGVGMPDDVRNKIFDPFFTTKPVGEGTGLGLSIVKGIIETHQGNIEVLSKIGLGTEFIITLPIKYID